MLLIEVKGSSAAQRVPTGGGLAWNRRVRDWIAADNQATREDKVSVFDSSSSEWTGRMLSVLRLVVGVLYFEHGTQKIFDIPPSVGPGPHVYHVMSLNGLAGILETFGGFAILVGLFTRPVAFILAGEMAVAYFKVHVWRSIFPINNRGDNVVLFCFVFLLFMWAGGGPWSIDGLIARARRPRAEAGDTLSP